MSQIVQIFRDRKLGEKLDEVRRWKEEGKSKEDVLILMDRRILREEDIDKIYNENNSHNIELKSDSKIINENVDKNKDIASAIEEFLEQSEEAYKNYLKNTEENKEDFLEEQEEYTQRNVKKSEEYKELKDEELVDFPDQPFKLYNEEQKQEMIQSIKINGIIQPIIVRPIENNKYQILAGHNRRDCGREAGLKTFPCKIKYGLTDEEAKLYLVDTNLATRKEITPTEKAKALLIRKNVYTTEKIKSKIEKGILGDNLDSIDVRKKMLEIENMSNGNLQRYLRLNYLTEKLQNLTDNKTISLKVAENLSYLPQKQQELVGDLIEKENIKISEKQAIRLKEENELTIEKIREFLINKINEHDKGITIKFSKDELKEFFENLEPENIKKKILELLREQ